jgi:hypothetical protein
MLLNTDYFGGGVADPRISHDIDIDDICQTKRGMSLPASQRMRQISKQNFKKRKRQQPSKK